MRRMRRIFVVLLLLSVILFSAIPAYAADYKVVIDKQIADTKYFDGGYGYITKNISYLDDKNNELQIDLEISNKSQNKEFKQFSKTEVYLIITSYADENRSLLEVAAAKEMAKQLLEKPNMKVGVVQIIGPVLASTKGSLDDAKVIVKATDNIETFNNDIINNKKVSTGTHTDVEAAIQVSKKAFSDDVNKYLILPDYIPLSAIWIENAFTIGKWEEKVQELVNATKQTVLSLKDESINLITLRPSDDSYNNVKDSNGNYYDVSEYVTELYGTVDKPTYGMVLDSSNMDTNQFISNHVSQVVISQIPADMKTLTITDYFPAEIIDNFEFSYVTKPETGTISEKITDNKIVYTVDKLVGNDSIKISYKLKLKDVIKENILDKVLLTNEKVTSSYTDINNVKHDVIQTSSPSIKLVEVLNNIPDTKFNQFTIVKFISVFIILVGVVLIVKIVNNKKKIEG